MAGIGLFHFEELFENEQTDKSRLEIEQKCRVFPDNTHADVVGIQEAEGVIEIRADGDVGGVNGSLHYIRWIFARDVSGLSPEPPAKPWPTEAESAAQAKLVADVHACEKEHPGWLCSGDLKTGVVAPAWPRR